MNLATKQLVAIDSMPWKAMAVGETILMIGRGNESSVSFPVRKTLSGEKAPYCAQKFWDEIWINNRDL